MLNKNCINAYLFVVVSRVQCSYKSGIFCSKGNSLLPSAICILMTIFGWHFFVDNLLLTKYLLTNLLLLMEVASMSALVESESPRPHYSKTGLGDLAIKLTNKNKHLKHDCMIVLISRWNSQLRRNIKILNWTPVLTLIYIHSGSKIIELYRFVNIRIWIIMTNPRAKRDERLNRGTLKVW